MTLERKHVLSQSISNLTQVYYDTVRGSLVASQETHPRKISIGRKVLVRGLPKLLNTKNKICDACHEGKQTKLAHKRTNQESLVY